MQQQTSQMELVAIPALVAGHFTDKVISHSTAECDKMAN